MIAYAIGTSYAVEVYDENGGCIFYVSINGPPDGLLGFTSSTVSVRCGSYIHVYDESGAIIRAVPMS
jgi:hypothetical protein